VYISTLKENVMKILLALLALVFTPVYAQEMLKGKVVIGQGICDLKDKEYNCLLAVDPKNQDIGYLVLMASDGQPLVVIEANMKTGEAKEVWNRKSYI